jgi:CDGSH-type Zn-finger protein
MSGSVTGSQIRIVPGGPMLVRGLALRRLVRGDEGWHLEETGIGEDYALCRCGRSATMPRCDRDEPFGCFEETPPTAPDPAPFRWDVPDPSAPGLALKPDGPVRVAGGVPIAYGARDLEPVDRVSLCRCGASRCQPLCDSSHKAAGYRG